MKITRQTASRLQRMIEYHGTPECALNDARVSMTSIRPYTDRELERVADVLIYILSKTPETREKLIRQVAAIATAAKPPSFRIALQCNECGRKYSVGQNNTDPQCPKCNGVDYEVL